MAEMQKEPDRRRADQKVICIRSTTGFTIDRSTGSACKSMCLIQPPTHPPARQEGWTESPQTDRAIFKKPGRQTQKACMIIFFTHYLIINPFTPEQMFDILIMQTNVLSLRKRAFTLVFYVK